MKNLMKKIGFGKSFRGFVFAFAFVFTLQSGAEKLFARGAQELVQGGHWIYDSLAAISLESGMVNFGAYAPLSIQQVKLILDEIDYDSLSDSGKADYDKILDYCDDELISFVSDIISVGLEPSLNIEGFYKTESDVDWIHDRYQRKPMLDVPFTISCADYVTMSMDLYLGQNKAASLHNFNYTNIFYNPDDFDINFPDTGYFAAGKMLTEKTGISFAIGKGPRTIGRTLTGSMIWSEYLTGASYAQIELFSPNFRYTGGVTQFNVDKYMYHHQLDGRFFNNKLQITAVEGLLVYAPMELRYLNPWMIFHGIAAWREYMPMDDDPESNTCDYLGLSAQFSPVKNTRFYGTFAMTQFQTAYERKNYPDTPTPNGLGAQLGNETYVPHGDGRFHFGIEGSWADSYLYIKESPNWSMVRTYSENMGDKAVFYEWIGSPFGPDTVSGELTCGYEVPGKWSVDFIYLFMARGENSGNNVFNRMKDSKGNALWGGQKTWFDTDEKTEFDKDGNVVQKGGEYEYLSQWAYPAKGYNEWEHLKDLVSPSGTVELVNRLSVRAGWQATDKISFTAQPSFVYIVNRHNQQGKKAHGFEIAAAVNINFIK